MSRHLTKAKTHVFRNDDLSQVLVESEESDIFIPSKTKLVITVGPACQSVEALCELLEAGATCARIDLTWAPIEYHRLSLRNLQEAMRRTRRLCAVMLDSLGREIMVRRKYGVDENGWPGIFDQLQIQNGQTVTFTTDPNVECTNTLLPVTYPKFPAMCQPGDSIFVGRYLVTGADTSLYLEVTDVTDTEVICAAKNTATLDGLLTIFHQERSTQGLSNLQNDLPALTDFDRQAIQILASEFDVDFISLSYCRSVEDVQEAREFVESIGHESCKVLAKCETRQALMNFRSIVNASDGVIISRGNLGLDVAAEKMAMVQKAMISTCAIIGKPSIITRVVDTMIQTPRPTRAEATDIANAVLDGVDGILLGAETYRGKYALDAVNTVVAICREAEAAFDHHNHFEHLVAEAEYWVDPEDAATDADIVPRGKLVRSMSQSSMMSEANIGFAYSSANLRTPGVAASPHQRLESIAAAAVKTADKVGASLIVVVTSSGKTASLVARYRPAMPIMSLVVPYLKRDGMKWSLEGKSAARQSLIVSGLFPVLAAPAQNAGESLIEEAVMMAARNNIVKCHDHVVVISRNLNDEYMIKVVSIDESGAGIKAIRPKSLLDMIKGLEEAHSGYVNDGDAAAANGRSNLQQGRTSSVLVGKAGDPLVVSPNELHGVGEYANGVKN